MLIVTPSFNLNGRCEEAIRLYEKAFGAKVQFMLRYAEAVRRDFAAPLTEEQKKLIYHAEMLIGGQRIFFSDIIEFDLAKGNSLFLAITFDDAASVKQAYEVLKEGGMILIPMKSTTYSSCFVSLVDKFGFRWALFTEQTEK